MDKLTKRTLSRAFEADNTLRTNLFAKDEAIQQETREKIAALINVSSRFVEVHFKTIVNL